MTYVNRVAEITHSMVDRYGGAANKNIGDAFLLVWKFHDPNQLE
jgi:class 3 adenylate cyclase